MRARRRLRRVSMVAVGIVLGAFGVERVLDVASPFPLARLNALETSVTVLAENGDALQVFPTAAGERVLPARFVELPAHLQSAILVAEDARFFEHGGVDVLAVLRAALQNAAAGRVVSGASTLTQQLVRIAEPRPRTFQSKVIEAFRARQLERHWEKERIIDAWVTHVPMGGTLRGFEAAAHHWFGMSARQLDLAQSAALVALVPAPSARAPHRHGAFLRERRDALLGRMQRVGVITPEASAAARATELGAARHAWPQEAWHAAALERESGGSATRTTALDRAAQTRVEALLTARDLPGDAFAVVVLRRSDAGVRALVNGPNAAPGDLDLARARRSVGSTLKPFLYALGREHGAVTGTQRLVDAPIELSGLSPANFDGEFLGSVRAADALARSSNLPAVRLLERIGTARFAALLAQLGFDLGSRGLELDSALGTLSASPLELARAYQRFAEEPERLGLSRASVDWVLAALASTPPAPGSPADRIAWKSGTSSGQRDAWCVALTADAVIVVWLGNREGHGGADLVGTRIAAALAADVVALL